MERKDESNRKRCRRWSRGRRRIGNEKIDEKGKSQVGSASALSSSNEMDSLLLGAAMLGPRLDAVLSLEGADEGGVPVAAKETQRGERGKEESAFALCRGIGAVTKGESSCSLADRSC